MGELRVSHRVPLPAAGRRDSGTLLFKQWLPRAENPIRIVRPPLTVLVTVDPSCVTHMGELNDEILAQWLNINVTSALVDVAVVGVADELGEFIVEKQRWPQGEDILNSENPEVRRLAEDYSALGHQVLKAVLMATSRLCAWASAEHGHYWLSARGDSAANMMSDNNGFNAAVSWNGGPQVRWCPPNREVGVVLCAHQGIELGPEDWAAACDFVGSNRRSDAVGEIYANAKVLLDDEQTRGAVIEAVAALELAVNRFADSPDLGALRADRPHVRDTFAPDFKHLGFTLGVRHLLPLLFAADVLNEQTLAGADAAIDCRHRIVHGAQRGLAIERARTHVAAAGELIRILQEATLERGIARS